MPTLITENLKGKELYFDLRPGGIGEAEGFWAVPVFDSDNRAVELEHIAHGGEGLWVELLVRHIKRWVGLRNSYGESVPCTAENIRSLCNSDSLLMRRMLARMQETAKAMELVASKN